MGELLKPNFKESRSKGYKPSSESKVIFTPLARAQEMIKRAVIEESLALSPDDISDIRLMNKKRFEHHPEEANALIQQAFNEGLLDSEDLPPIS